MSELGEFRILGRSIAWRLHISGLCTKVGVLGQEV
jgi:hypothetical protein